jgi:hypothetical protein
MKDRRDLQDELNRINELYQEYDLELRKSGGSDAQRQQMRDTLNAKKAKLTAEMGDDLQNLNLGKDVKVSGGTLSGTEIDQAGLPDMSKQKGLGKEGIFKRLGKKVAGVIPLAGAAYGLASGDPAMAAEEAAGDIPVIGQAYEAIKPEMAGNPEEERMMLAEDKARKAYSQSPAAMDAKESALKKLRGY